MIRLTTMLRLATMLLLLIAAQPAVAATIRVPEDHKTIQAAIDAAEPGDIVLVGPGRFIERIAIGPGVTVRSAGDESRGDSGLKRAEATILNGGGKEGDSPGVVLAEGSTLDGFTVANVGVYDEATWQKHFESHGETLGDDEGTATAEGSIPAIRAEGVNCTIVNNVVHHNGDVGIAVIGSKERRVAPRVANNVCYRNLGGGIGVADLAEPIVQSNICYENLRAGIGCRNASPIVLDNECHHNVRAGIGCRDGARPIVRGNTCYGNRRAGIGVALEGTAPIVEDNECYENDMAGIGTRDGAEPVLRNNQCYRNKMAGIGCDGSRPLIVGNECRENEMAGIGLRGGATATIQDNRCIENKLVALGVTQGSTASVSGNHFVRTGGVPPLVAVDERSTAWLRDNEIKGGGVASILVQGTATVVDNRFEGRGKEQGSAVWVWQDATATVVGNSFSGYRAVVDVTQANVVVTNNVVRSSGSPAIIVRDSPEPAHVFANTVISKDENAVVVEIQGPSGIVAENVVQGEEAGDSDEDDNSEEASDTAE